MLTFPLIIPRRSPTRFSGPRGLNRLVLLIFTAITLWPMPAAVRADGLHPQDGPHVDVRIMIDDRGVALHLMMNLVFVDAIADVPRENHEVVHPIEMLSMRDALLEVLGEGNVVRINGEVVEPVMRDFEKLEPDISLLPLFPVSGLAGLSTVRMTLEYPASAPPQEVGVVWGFFPVDILFTTVNSTRLLDIAAEITGEGVRSNIYFTRSEPEYIWHATGETIDDRMLAVPDPLKPRIWRIPVVSVGLVVGLASLLIVTLISGTLQSARKVVLFLVSPFVIVCALLTTGMAQYEMLSPFDRDRLLTAEEAVSIFEPLHANIYRAFDYTNESDIYDALSRSVDGRLLDDLYNQIFRSLILYEEGGAVSRVEEVTPITYEVGQIGTIERFGGAFGFHVSAQWEVLGTVYHWGHSHSRLNKYLADYTVIDTDSGWRIADNRVIEQFRINLDEPELQPDSRAAPVIPPGTEL